MKKNGSRKPCPTPQKLRFNTRKEAYQFAVNYRSKLTIYQCRCGAYHTASPKIKNK